jgi:hypothetical protein
MRQGRTIEFGKRKDLMRDIIRNLLAGFVTGITVNVVVQCSAINGKRPVDWMEVCIAGSIAGAAALLPKGYRFLVRVLHNRTAEVTVRNGVRQGTASGSL